MIPRRYGRTTGSGGGGTAKFSSTIPYFCKKCGKTKPSTQFMDSVDVCKSCRIGKKKGK